MKNKQERKNLCPRCVDNYRQAGYELKRVEYGPNVIKEECDFCGFYRGFLYWVKEAE